MGSVNYRLRPNAEFENILSEWKPKSADGRRSEPASEKEYERSLVDTLRDNLEGIQIIPGGGKGMFKSDITIQRKGLIGGSLEDIVELKLGMNSTGAYQRLVGQIESYQPGRHGWVFIVICGEPVDPKLLSELKTKYRGTPFISVYHKKGSKKGVKKIV